MQACVSVHRPLGQHCCGWTCGPRPYCSCFHLLGTAWRAAAGSGGFACPQAASLPGSFKLSTAFRRAPGTK
eukprot:1258999-Pyramimonas_sp.AAC.1